MAAQSYKDSFSGLSNYFIFGYADANYSSSVAWYYVSKGESGSIYYPGVALIDTKDRIRYISCGNSSIYDGTAINAQIQRLVNEGPVQITSQPVSATIAEGKTATFSLSASSKTAISYSWQVSTDGGVNYSGVNNGTGSTTASYTTPTVTKSMDGYLYRCVVSNSSDSATSSAARLNVITNTCGDNLTWRIENGALKISGTGRMYDYSAGTAPWNSRKNEFSEVMIENGASYLGNYAFYGCTALKQVCIPDSLSSFGNNVFNGCRNLSKVYFMGNIPSSAGSQVFYNCAGGLKLYYLPGRTGWPSSWNGYSTALMQYGDVDGNGAIGVGDAVKTTRFSVWLDIPNDALRTIADVNRDSRIDVTDVLLITRYTAGTISRF